MTLAILGAGRVGRSLGRALTDRSYRVRFGVTDPDKHRDLAADPRFSVGSVAAATDTCEVVVLVTPYSRALHLAAEGGDRGGRNLVDATDPIAPGISSLLVVTTSSGAQENAALVGFDAIDVGKLEAARYAGRWTWAGSSSPRAWAMAATSAS